MKKGASISIFVLLFICFSCNVGSKNESREQESLEVSTNKNELDKEIPDSEREFIDRLKLTGDFNGDKIVDTIYESYTSKLTGKETAKEFEAEDYEQEVEKIVQNQPVCKLKINIPQISVFTVTEDPQQTGIAMLENLGDLNNNGGDEIGYIIKYADFSNMNSYNILSLNGNKFEVMYDFKINEAINMDPEYLYKGVSIIKKTGFKKFKHKFYSDEAEVEEKEVTLE